MKCIDCEKDFTKRIVKGLCHNCYSRQWTKNHRKSVKKTQRNWVIKNKDRHNFLGKKNRWKHKLELIKAYGSKCNCCGEDIPEFLTIDHINGDGNKWRKENSRRSHDIYRILKHKGYPKKDHQLLCFNCNYGKYFRGKCPHKIKDNEDA